MCGRFTLSIEESRLKQKLGLEELPEEWTPRFNIAPSQQVLVVADPTLRKAEFMRWGLIPPWAKDISIGNQLINARSETLNEKPSFRQAFARRRCLILADGFYEWQKIPGKKGLSIPYYFQLVEHEPFGLAGLWEQWRSPEGEEIKSCTIITCAANAVVSPIHERMPVLFKPDQFSAWLQQKTLAELQPLLTSYPAENMVSFAVSNIVNSPAVDNLECIKPIL
jgi:putative SOS response-associated peptidase YedK